MKSGREVKARHKDVGRKQGRNNPPELFEQHGLVRGDAEPLRGLVTRAEDLKILRGGLHALIPAGKIKRRVARGEDRTARVVRKNLALQAMGECLHGFKVKIGAGESAEIDQL